MKTIYAMMAAALITTGVGCSALNSCNSCGPDGCHITQSQMAPRASMQNGRCNDSNGILAKCGWINLGGNRGCGDCCEPSCGCEGGLFCNGGCYGGGCESGCCNGGCNNGCLQGGLSRLIDCNGCNGGPCGQGGGFCGFCGGGDRAYNFNPGPPVGQTAYPYYTVRGPRDFLMANPPSIGPR